MTLARKTLATLQSDFQVLVPAFPYSSYTARVTQWFNDAQKAVGEAKLIDDKAYTYTEEDDNGDIRKEYSLPDNLIQLKKRGVFFNGQEVQPASLVFVRNIYGASWKSATRVDVPEVFFREGHRITFVPGPKTADLEIELHYFGHGLDLVNSTDVPFTTGSSDIGYDYHHHLRGLDELLLTYAIRKAEYSLGNYATEQDALRDFWATLEKKKEDIKSEDQKEYQEVAMDPFMAKKLRSRANAKTTQQTNI